MFRSWRQSVRELGERVERLEGELGRLNMENADLKSQLKERDARIAKLESVLEESRRAGKRQAAPFSKDKPKRDPKKPGRKPGSKYGRQAVRAIPVPDKTFEAPCPEQCPCGGKVGAEGSIDLYQVDIPPIQPETWKFVVGHGHCQECGWRVRGQHPLLISKAFEVGTVHFGPRLLAFAAFQKMICGVSYDKIRLGFEQMLGFPVARSTLCRAMQRLARRAKPTRDALVEALRASPVVYADETGWKQGGRRVWLWVFTNLRETVYEILPGRGFEQAASVLGKNYAGTLGVDGWAPYRCFKEATLQTCYNHLLHRCHELLETATRGGGALPTLGQGHPPARPRLARSARCWRDQPAWPARCQGTPPGEDKPPAARADSPILPTSDSRNICDAIGTTSLCSSTVRTLRPPTIPPNKTFASPWSTARPAEAATVPRKGHRPSRSS